jgi:hypothetical protein
MRCQVHDLVSAIDIAKCFRVSGVVATDGTAFPDDADMATEIEQLIRAVEERRSP